MKKIVNVILVGGLLTSLSSFAIHKKGGEVSGGGTFASGAGLDCSVLVDLLVYNSDFRDICVQGELSHPLPQEQKGILASILSSKGENIEAPPFDRFTLLSLPETWALKETLRKWSLMLPGYGELFYAPINLLLSQSEATWFVTNETINERPDHFIPDILKEKFLNFRFTRAAFTNEHSTIFSWSTIAQAGLKSRMALVLHELLRVAFPKISTASLQNIVGALVLEPQNNQGLINLKKVLSKETVVGIDGTSLSLNPVAAAKDAMFDLYDQFLRVLGPDTEEYQDMPSSVKKYVDDVVSQRADLARVSDNAQDLIEFSKRDEGRSIDLFVAALEHVREGAKYADVERAYRFVVNTNRDYALGAGMDDFSRNAIPTINSMKILN